MALEIKVLALDKLATINETAIYTAPKTPTAPKNQAAIVKNMRFTNTDTTQPVTLTLKLQSAGLSKTSRISPVDLSIPAKCLVLDNHELTMEPGDQILATAGTADKIEYVLSGIVRDV